MIEVIYEISKNLPADIFFFFAYVIDCKINGRLMIIAQMLELIIDNGEKKSILSNFGMNDRINATSEYFRVFISILFVNIPLRIPITNIKKIIATKLENFRVRINKIIASNENDINQPDRPSLYSTKKNPKYTSMVPNSGSAAKRIIGINIINIV